MDKREQLLQLLDDDPLRLLDVQEKQSRTEQRQSVLRNNFEEIVSFIEDRGCEPSSNLNDIDEYKLFCRLKTIRSNPEMVKELKPYDMLNLLQSCKELSLEDMLADDPMGLLNEDFDSSIFQLRNVSPSGRINPDYVARRKQCKNFSDFKPLFDTLHDELEQGKRKLVPYNSSKLKECGFYVLNGILIYLESVKGEIINHSYQSGERERFDGRTVCIFDNGTYSDMLFRSLDKALQKDGYCVSEIITDMPNEQNVTDDDVSNGYIYVLKSKHPYLKGIDNIYKIGCTKTSVSQRIKNATNDATYLYADVEVVETFRCYNIKAYDVEQTIHSFLDSVRLDIQIPGANNSVQKPKEWFIVSLDVIEEIVKLIQADAINQYLYDSRCNKILKKN